MKRKHRTYTREFKEEAVQLANRSGKRTSEIEEELGITRGLLVKWKRKLSEEGSEAFRGQGRRSSAEEEIRQLRRENAILKQERDVLKKALAIFTPDRKR